MIILLVIFHKYVTIQFWPAISMYENLKFQKLAQTFFFTALDTFWEYYKDQSCLRLVGN